MFDSKFDQEMKNIHAINMQQTEMRRLIANCTDRDFMDYFMDKVIYFPCGASAKEYFDSCFNEYKRKVQLQKYLRQA